MALSKIDNQGNYLRFPGVTVISNVGQTNQKLWQNIHNFLVKSPVLSAYFAPLPLQSYHMTTCNLYTEEESPGDWQSFISAKLSYLQKINEKLASMQFSPLASIERVNFFPTLELVLTIPPDQNAILQKFGDEISMQHQIPSDFHITLAYGYKEIDDEVILKAIKDEIIKLTALCEQYDKKIVLSPPQLNFFNSMEKFIPWDGSTNPFLKTQAHANPFGLFTNKDRQQEPALTLPICIIM